VEVEKIQFKQLDALHALASVGERKKKEHTCALGCLASPGTQSLPLRICVSTAYCAAVYAASSRSSACTGDRESRSPEPRPQRSCIGRGRIRFLIALCATARTLPHRRPPRPHRHGSSSSSSVGHDSASSSTRRC
jgi:hypothetical protein